MNETRPRALPQSARPRVGGESPADGSRAVAEKSFRKDFPHAAHSALLGRRFDMDRYRAVFPERFAEMLRDHPQFGGDPARIALFFDVTPRTAENWLAGHGRATGDRVALIAAWDPEGFAGRFGPELAA